jgi:hypothetical protein
MRDARNQARRRIELSLLIADQLAAEYNRSEADAERVTEACGRAAGPSASLPRWVREYAALVAEGPQIDPG